MTANVADFKAIAYCICIGVTGHRKLDDPAAVQALVKKALDTEIENLLPENSKQKIKRVRETGTIAISFRLLSPLAEGADRVVARAILDYPGARLEAVLPLAVEDYLEDFASEESRKEFHELLNQSGKTEFLRARRIRDECTDPADQAESRLAAYEQVGRYVVDHCDVLIAVWDGQQSHQRGGTAEVVRYALSENRPVLRVWEDSLTVLSRTRGQLLFVES